MKLIIFLFSFILSASAIAADDDPVITGDEFWNHTDGPYGGSVWSLYADDNLLLAGTLSHGIYFSTDHGESWLQSGLDEGSIYDIDRSPDQTLIAAGQEGVYLSFNNGRSWEEANEGLGDAIPQAVLAVSEDEVHLATIGEGMFLWEGDRWIENNDGLGLKFGYSLALHKDEVFAGITNDVYRWSREEQTWTKLDLDLPQVRVNDLISFEEKILAATQEGMYVSDDMGDNWSRVASEFEEEYTYSLSVNDGMLFVGTRNGVYTSEAGENWEKYGLEDYTVYSLAVGGGRLFSGGNPGVFTAQ